MRVARRLTVTSIATLALLAGTGVVTSQAFAHGSRTRPDHIVVRGDVEQRLHLTADDLGKLQQHTVDVTFETSTSSERHTFTGPLLLDVLDAAVPEFDTSVKNDKLRHVVDVTGSDGYEVAVAWGEVDPFFENKQVLVALAQDGVALGDAGPRLVVQGDGHGGRYVSDVTTIRLSVP